MTRRRRLPKDQRAVFGALALLAAIFAVLSMGPALHIDGHFYRIPLPELYLQILPFWRDTLPERLAAVTALLVALLVGVAFDALWQDAETDAFRRRALRLFIGTVAVWGFATADRLTVPAAAIVAAVMVAVSLAALATLRTRVAGVGRFIVGATLVVLVLLGSWPVSYPETQVPAVSYADTVRQAGGSVFYVPAVVPETLWGQGDCTYMYLAAVFGLPTPEGYVSRLPYSTVRGIDRSPVLGYLWGVQYGPNPEARLKKPAAKLLDRYLNRHGVRTVVVETTLLADPWQTLTWLSRALGPSWHPQQVSSAVTLFTRQPVRGIALADARSVAATELER